MDIIKTYSDDATKIVDLVANRIKKTTVEIYSHSLDNSISIKPEQIATGVLLKTESNFYLITAAHTFKDFKKEDLCLYKSQSKIPLVGRVFLFDPRDSKTNDLIDIALIKLEGFVVDAINNNYQFDFLDYRLIKQRHNLIPSKSYFTLGFPFKKEIIKKREKHFFSQPYLFYIHPSNSKKYNQPDVEKDFNFLLDFNRRKFKSFGKKGRTFAPQTVVGMSGSGLWFIPKFVSKPTDKLSVFLIGILIELKGKTNSLMFTRIDCVTEMLRKCCTENFETFSELKTELYKENN